MIKFFRHIRQRLLKENKTSKYLLYAIGEIILVVIGILIALQINTWNEHRKSASNELTILTSLNSDLKENLNELNEILDLLETSIENGHKVIVALEHELEVPDSISIWLDLLNRNPLFNNANTTYLKLESSSEALISDDSLRVMITMMYEREFNNVLRREQINLNNIFPVYKKELHKSFKVGPNKSVSGNGIIQRVNIPVDYTVLRQEHSFNNALVDLNNFKKIRTRWLKVTIERLEDLILKIDTEIDLKQ